MLIDTPAQQDSIAPEEAERFELARQNRDPRFDGHFFVGVLTTGIYCRPTCPVKIPRRENVQLYRSAAAAAAAGFRPCLRCRPEASPGTPAWLGSSHTVSRALQLISLEPLDEDSIGSLAAALEISSRQLGRLFQRHLGASPSAVMKTRRLHFAKQLIDETSLPMSEVCFAAGFSSVRRFNQVIRDTYGRTPSQLRQRAAPLARSPTGITVTLGYRPPFDWPSLLEFLARRSIPGIEAVDQTSYRRTFLLAGRPGHFALQFSESQPQARLTIDYPDPACLLAIVERVRDLFDLRADSALIDAALASDPALAPMVSSTPGLRVPGCWDGLELAVRAIVGQQVSVAAATTLMRRLAERTGTPFPAASQQTDGKLERLFPDARTLATANLDGLGITGQRLAAIRALAASVLKGQLRFDRQQCPQAFCRQVCELKGVGAWTADYIALRALRNPDAFLAGDLILRRALQPADPPLSKAQLLARAEVWRPWRAYAVMLLWRHYQSGQTRTVDRVRSG